MLALQRRLVPARLQRERGQRLLGRLCIDLRLQLRRRHLAGAVGGLEVGAQA